MINTSKFKCAYCGSTKIEAQNQNLYRSSYGTHSYFICEYCRMSLNISSNDIGTGARYQTSKWFLPSRGSSK